jgi:hypothetical protein
MALVINDRVKETTTTTGTGAVSLAGAVTGFETFAAGVGNSNTTYYCIAHQTAAEFEVGLGTLDGDSSDLTRTTVISSSNSDSAVDFAAGTKDVFCTIPASKLIFEDANNDATVGRNLTVTGDLTVSGDDITMATNTSGNILVADGTNFNSIAVGDLSAISTVAADDVLLAVDTSGGGLKKIARSALVSGLAAGTMSELVDDTSPQLGGDLDINGNGLVSTSNGNIALTPNGSGVVRIDGSNGIDIQSGAISIKNSGTQSYVDFYCESSNAHYARLQAPAHSAFSGNITLTMPATTDTLVGRTTTDTLTNKTLTTPVIAEIDSGSTITLDATTDIVLDADGGDIFLKDAGTTFGEFTNSSTDFVIKSTTSDKDIIFKGNDGGSAITALTLDMSAAGAATFNDKITAVGTSVFTNLDISGDVDVDGTLETDALSIASTTVTSTAAELNILDGVTSTATELNVMDGDTSASSVTLVDADRLVTNDAGTMKQVALTTLKTYLTSAGFSTEDPTALAIALG